MIIDCKKIANNIKAELPRGAEYYNELCVITGEMTESKGMYLGGILKDAKEFDVNVSLDTPFSWSCTNEPYKYLYLDRPYATQDTINIEYPVPCTAVAVIEVLDGIDIDVEGKTVLVIGRGEASGKPIAKELLDRNATVIQAHSYTTKEQLIDLMRISDIVISCAGVQNLIKDHMVKPSHIIIDVGNDVDFEAVKDKVAYITPQKQGIGLVTRACLLRRLVKR